jgi:uncharacterized integral membrane protein
VLALGVILILLAAGAFVAVLSSGADEQATLFGGNVELPTMVVFLAGAVAMLLFIMGLELFRSGVRRANHNRRTKKKLRTLEQGQEGRADHAGSDHSTAAPSSDPPSQHR